MRIAAFALAAGVVIYLGLHLPVGEPAGARTLAPRDDRIAFFDGRDLKLSRADGSGVRRLATCGATPICAIVQYAWSPNGRRIAFLRGNLDVGDGTGKLSLFVVNANGRGERLLADCGPPPDYGDCGRSWRSPLSWSPDSSSIVFTRGRALAVANATNGALHTLTDCASLDCSDVQPAWSPDGSEIAFARWTRGVEGWSLYAVRPDGSSLNKLADFPGWVGDPAWAPDGRTLTVDTADGTSNRMYLIAADGHPLRELFAGPPGSGPFVPSWSRDGGHILFFNTPGTPGHFAAEVWMMNADGTQPQRLYHSICCIDDWGRPAWSPDEQYIAFSLSFYNVESENKSGTFRINADGSHARRLFRFAPDPAWQPLP
jgi:Tol biopolymer transport system component